MDFLADGLEILPRAGGDPVPFLGQINHEHPLDELNGMGIQITVTALECREANLNGYELKRGDEIHDTTTEKTYRIDRQPTINDGWVIAVLKG